MSDRTPLERGAEAVKAELHRPAIRSLEYSRKLPERLTRAAFESINREGLADLIESTQTEWRMDSRCQDRPLADHTADAIRAWLLSEGGV